MKRQQASEYDQELLDLYDDYAHGRIGRRKFIEGAAKFVVGGLTAEALLASLSPNYAWAQQVPKIKATMLLHYGELDKRINAGWPAYEAALKKAQVEHTAYMYEGANHGFHNDTTPRYDEADAKLAWSRTIDFFNKTLR